MMAPATLHQEVIRFRTSLCDYIGAMWNRLTSGHAGEASPVLQGHAAGTGASPRPGGH